MRLSPNTLNGQKFLLGPAWRSNLAKQLVLENVRLVGCEDAALRDFIWYAQKCNGCGGEESAAAAFPAIAAALAINDNSVLVDELKLMVSGQLDAAEILRRTNLDPAALTTWMSLFFDITDYFSATTWLAGHVIGPEREAGRNMFAAKLAMSLRGGRDAALLALAAGAGLPLAPAERLEKAELQLALKMDLALNMEVITPEDSFRFVKLNLEIDLARQKLALANQKFAVRCAELQRRHERQEQAAADKQAKADAARHRAVQQDLHRQQQVARAAGSRLAQFTWRSAERASQSILPDGPPVIPLPIRAEKAEQPLGANDGKVAAVPVGGRSDAVVRTSEAGASEGANQRQARRSA